MIIHDERFEPAFQLHGRRYNKTVGKLGEELIVDLLGQHGIRAVRTVSPTHPIDIIIDDTYGVEVKTFMNYRTSQVRLSKPRRRRSQRFCKSAGLIPVTVAVRKLEDSLLWTEFPADFEILYGMGIKGYPLNNMTSIRRLLNQLNGGKADPALQFFTKAMSSCVLQGYGYEIRTVRERTFDRTTSHDFYDQYVFVVLNSGMRNQTAQKMYDRFCRNHDPDTVGHPGKREAIRTANSKYFEWFDELIAAEDKLAYLETLPWIGPITKFHLARNLGIDVAKPDRHMVRLADRLKFKDAHEMCDHIAEATGERVGTVDVILWRYCNLGGK